MYNIGVKQKKKRYNFSFKERESNIKAHCKNRLFGYVFCNTVFFFRFVMLYAMACDPASIFHVIFIWTGAREQKRISRHFMF